MFYDEVKVSLRAGNGGDGCLVFEELSMSLKVVQMVVTVAAVVQ